MQPKKVFILFFVSILFSQNLLFSFLTKKSLFKKTGYPLTNEQIITNPDALLSASEYALGYFHSKRWIDRSFTRSKLFDDGLINRKHTEDTLKFIIKTIKEDKKHKRTHRILDRQFLKKNFDFIRWHCDRRGAQQDNVTIPRWHDSGKLLNGKIKLTSYALFRRKGSYYKTKQCPYALYEIMTNSFSKAFRRKYSKHTILNGVLEQKRFKKHLKPLVWLSRENIEEALMQGSIIIIMPNGRKRLFNVFKSNGFPYDKKIKNRRDQKKYWFFKEIKSNKEPEGQRVLPFLKFGGVVFAGDVRNIGLGKIIAIKYQNPKNRKKGFLLGVLADRGSAFSNNLYQLDLFSGIFNTKAAFYKFLGQFPPSVAAYLLKKRTV